MTNKDLIKQYVDTGILIPEYQFNQLSNNLKTTYLRKRGIVGNLIDYEIIMLPDDVRTKYIKKLKSNGIFNLLYYSKEPDKIKDILLSTEGFINNLDSYGIRYLLMYSKEPEKIMNILGNKGIVYINKLDFYEISLLLKNSNFPEKIMNILGNKGIEFINNLDSKKINSLLKNSKEKEKISEIIRKYRADIELNESKLKLSNLI